MPDQPTEPSVVPPPPPVVGFDAFIEPHLPTLFGVARSLTGNAHDAEDLVQETMLRAFRALDRFDGEHPRAWLLTIMRNANINRHRRRRPGLLRETDAAAVAADRRTAALPSAEDEATANSSPAWLSGALARLSAPHLDVVTLVDIDGLTYDEAAAALGVPVGTIMSRLHRARQRMRTHLTHDPAFRSSR